MAQPTQVRFGYAETIAALLRAAGIHEGRWTLCAWFAPQAASARLADGTVVPAMVNALEALGIVRVPPGDADDADGVVIVDAALANPREQGTDAAGALAPVN